MDVDFTQLTRALRLLENTVLLHNQAIAEKGAKSDLALALRAGVIQHFEMAYELCWKAIQRWLRVNTPAGDQGVRYTMKELYREAAQFGLIADPGEWYQFLESRNKSVHVYDESIAEDVVSIVPQFLKATMEAVARMEKRND